MCLMFNKDTVLKLPVEDSLWGDDVGVRWMWNCLENIQVMHVFNLYVHRGEPLICIRHVKCVLDLCADPALTGSV